VNASAASRVSIVAGDITTFDVDAIVNAANEALRPGGGVCGAIHRAAGPELGAECATLGGCPTGQARLTRGYRLAARHVIHAVGPIWQGGDHGEADLLASAYRSSLELAVANGLRSIAFPAISCGVYGFPLYQAAEIAVGTVRQSLERMPSIERVVHVCFGDEVLNAFRRGATRVASGE
jgi:O-acetyl-ADP-ribose deacetylase (regulator of RNase III)